MCFAFKVLCLFLSLCSNVSLLCSAPLSSLSIVYAFTRFFATLIHHQSIQDFHSPDPRSYFVSAAFRFAPSMVPTRISCAQTFLSSSYITLSWCLTLLIFLSSRIRTAEADCPFHAIFNFGDSNSDTGGLVSAFPALSRPNGETTFNEPAGRFSDGRLIIDFLAQGIGLPFLNPYLQAIGSNFSTGANFASAGASVLQPGHGQTRPDGWLSPFYLQIQLNQFFQFKSKSLELYSKGWFQDVLPLPSSFENALYTIDMGQNDLSAQLSSGMTLDQASSIFPQVVDAIANTISSLYTTGARFFLVTNMGPMGCYPANLATIAHSTTDVDANGCLIYFNNIVSNFNDILRNRTFLLQTQLYGASIIYVDVYSIKYQLWANGASNGFQFRTTACCGPNKGEYNYDSTVTCTNSIIQGGQIITGSTCTDPNTYVSWDGIHFTENANRYVANQIFSGNFFQPSFPINQMCPISPF